LLDLVAALGIKAEEFADCEDGPADELAPTGKPGRPARVRPGEGAAEEATPKGKQPRKRKEG
jgi:hypothetical protein